MLEESCKKVTIWFFMNAPLTSLFTLICKEGKPKLPSVYQTKCKRSTPCQYSTGNMVEVNEMPSLEKGNSRESLQQRGRENRKYRSLVTVEDLLHLFFSCPSRERKGVSPKTMMVLHRTISPSTWHLSSVLC